VAEEEKAIAVLHSEGEIRVKEADLRKAKADAAEAAAAAKKALDDKQTQIANLAKDLASEEKEVAEYAEFCDTESTTKEYGIKDSDDQAKTLLGHIIHVFGDTLVWVVNICGLLVIWIENEVCAVAHVLREQTLRQPLSPHKTQFCGAEESE